MYARMLERLAPPGRRRAEARAADPDYLDVARQELYRGQCNCPYWHGAFGGLYLPHLRNAIYRRLIAAHNALDEAEGQTGPRVALEVADFNLDARQEVRLENDRLIAFVRPATGGHVYELDVRDALTNVLATLDRRPEAYHATIAWPPAAARGACAPPRRAGQHPRPRRPEAGGARPPARLRPSPPQGARRSLLPARRHPRRPDGLPRRRAGRLRRRRLSRVEGPARRPNGSRS